ncbi:MAG: alkene reductase [Candidatus Elarobacter sp.]
MFRPFQLGELTLANRVVMAPLTRDRATPGVDVPHALNVEYYRQRASAGLIIAEATQISATGKGYAWTPGIYSDAQVEGWRAVTDAVHASGGRIVLQLWHVGRISHVSLQPNGQAPVAPSAVHAAGHQTFIESGTMAEVSPPRALELSELPGILDDYRRATANALRAGFDGVEVHAANGYLLQQFLSKSTNLRTDAYGGSVENRLRFPLEVVKAVVETAGAEKTGVRLSPVSPANGVGEVDPGETYFPLVRAFDALELAYVHVVEGSTGGPRDFQGFDFHALRKEFRGAWMVNNGYTRELALEALANGYADLVAFGRPFIANPDLVERLRSGAPLNQIDPATLYGGGAEGYTDYPTLAGSAA